ncbi:hypothetical protein V3I01_15115 [Sphingomonas sp. gentR]|jgi:hypothetical protein|uniref:Uncharacterized protein n=1 Tax=Sphingomonas yabuuchiae TaxID=172044 RepID=A0A147ILA7_9SPHN|nr:MULTISPECIES: hypothetical protein [Sphingomonas]APX64511.1 hypothetical protein AV944_00090 [Sphingomonas sp. LK11]KQO56389.1 hypothetical protein ASF14_18650 [Sphingomonas sp. Leaf257]KTT95947.1 hypothetical protein NS355_15890 [Sphingomonas yabuuchiae]MBB4611138.1 hypothetical protein [Sphingomonas yabuuchiae]MBN3559186.1 hypothetical protein [Sphingomonas yabuuchiae]
MSRDAIFFRNQAEIERNNAADATLQNVRDRCERAAASWDAMAVRAERAELGRAAAAARAAL